MIQPGDIIETNLILELDIEKTIEKHHGKYWKVKCLQCNNIRSVRQDNLHQLCRKCASKNRPIGFNVQDDLTGRRFGNWLVLSKSKKSNYWHCKDITTGTERDVFRGNLISGKSKGDGSINSWGEQQILYLLNKYKIKFKKEFIFQDLLTDKNQHPRFDFGIFKDDELYCLIEYDGRQHYSFDKNWNMSEQDYQRLQYIDNLKNQYCINNNILLYRFNSQTDLEEKIKNIMIQMEE